MKTLPAEIQQLSTALAQRSALLGTGDAAFIRMNKQGEWLIGADELEPQEGSLWAINPHSFVEGYIAWGEGKVIDEKMAPMVGKPINLADLPDPGAEAKKGWEKQIGMMMACLNGEDVGLQVAFKSSSRGGIKAARSVINAIVSQITADPSHLVAVCHLRSEHYKHAQYGKIYTPLFEIVKWETLEATETTEDKPEAPAETVSGKPEAPAETVSGKPEALVEKVKPTRRRRPVATG